MIKKFNIEGPLLITPKRFGDGRGFFSETYNKRFLTEAGINEDFVQDNHSLSAQKGVVRGLHFQSPSVSTFRSELDAHHTSSTEVVRFVRTVWLSFVSGFQPLLCRDRAILLDGGELLLDGKPKQVTNQYLKLVHMPAEKLADAREMVRALQDLPDEDMDVPQEPKAGDAKGGHNVAVPALPGGPAEEEESEEAKERRLDEEEGWYDPNLKSQSVVEYESRGARIRDLRILAPSGRPVNVLKTGQRYTYEYYVDFDEDAEDVGFGMLIKTVSGLELAGAGMEHRKDLRLPSIKSGQSAKSKLEFSARLLPGVYYLNAGVIATVNGERDFVHRMLDGLIFQIAPEARLLATGMFDLMVQPHNLAAATTTEITRE